MNMAKTFVTAERVAELEEENARLREQLRWIPVTERLPKSHIPFAGYFQHGEMGMTFSAIARITEAGTWVLNDDGWRLMEKRSQYFLAMWYAIPQPPQEEGEK